MLPTFSANDIYRVMLGSDTLLPVARTLGEHSLRSEGPMRQMRRDDGRCVWVSVALIDGATLERISLLAAVQLMQIDNVSARLRAAPAIPGREPLSRLASAQRLGIAA